MATPGQLYPSFFRANGPMMPDGQDLQALAKSAVPLPFVGNIPRTGWTRPPLSAFSTWLNQNDPGGVPELATATDNTGGLPLVLQAGSMGLGPGQNSCLTALLKPVAHAPPWTVTMALAFYGNNIPYGGPVLYDTVNDKAEFFQWSGSQGGDGWLMQAFDGTGTSVVYDTLATLVAPVSDYLTWFRVTNDGTMLTYSAGPEGILFFPFYSEPVGSFLGTIDKIGFGYDRSFVYGPNAVILWQWVETSP